MGRGVVPLEALLIKDTEKSTSHRKPSRTNVGQSAARDATSLDGDIILDGDITDSMDGDNELSIINYSHIS